MTGTLATALLLAWMKACCIVYGVEPEFAWGVLRVESGVPGGPAIRLGRLGGSRYFGPFGIADVYGNDVNLSNPYVNILIGVAALRGQDKRRILRRYNAAFNEAYYRAVMALYRQARRDGNFHGQVQTRG